MMGYETTKLWDVGGDQKLYPYNHGFGDMYYLIGNPRLFDLESGK